MTVKENTIPRREDVHAGEHSYMLSHSCLPEVSFFSPAGEAVQTAGPKALSVGRCCFSF